MKAMLCRVFAALLCVLLLAGMRGEGAVHPAEPFGIPCRGKGGAI